MINDSIIGCFFQLGFDPKLSEQDFTEFANIFRRYIWGDKSICVIMKELKHQDYGKDLAMILFQFYVKPTSIEVLRIKKIESYRKNEKSIGIPIIVTDQNFFDLGEDGRTNFLKQSVLQKLEVLSEVVIKRKLDTKMDLLKANLNSLLA